MTGIMDIRGVKLVFETPPGRIISLVPSLTETLVDLGCSDMIAGCTRYCTDIAGFSGSQIVGGPLDPDVDLIRSLEPDLVLAGEEENRKEDVEAIEKFAQVYVCRPVTVGDAATLVEDIGGMCGAVEKARDYVDRIEEGRKSLNEFAEGRERISFIYLVWWNPAMAVGGGTYISSLFEEGPFSNVFGELERYPEIAAERMAERRADVIFLPSEPYKFTEKIKTDITNSNCDARIICVDGRMCGWYGSRTAKGIVYIADLYSRLIRTEC